MRPPRNVNGAPSLTRARKPTEVDIADPETGKWSLVDLAPGDPPDAHPKPNQHLMEQMIARPNKATRKRQKLTQVALGMYTAGLSLPDIADKLDVSMQTLTQWFSRHRREVAAEDIDVMLDQIAVPLATDNLVHGLLAGDKDYTLEVLKGRGKLKRHSEGDGKLQTELPALTIRFEKEEAGVKQTMVVGAGVVGRMALPRREDSDAAPAAIEGEVVGGKLG